MHTYMYIYTHTHIYIYTYVCIITSRKVMREGVSPTGGEPLHVRYATGLRPSTLDRPVY